MWLCRGIELVLEIDEATTLKAVRLADHHESDTGDPIRLHSIRLILDRMSESASCIFETVAIRERIKRYLRLMQI